MQVWEIILIVWFVVAAVFVALGLLCRRRTWVGSGGSGGGGGGADFGGGGGADCGDGGGDDFGGGGGGADFGGGGGADFGGGGGGADFGGGGGAHDFGGGGGAHGGASAWGIFLFYIFKFYYPNPIIKPNPVEEDGNVENHRLSLACCCILCLPFALWTSS
ncbi:hypothetical protein ACE6H2_021594 [Prunus campanulata]